MIDLRQSRRKQFFDCKVRKKIENENFVPNNQLVHETEYSQEFTAEITNAIVEEVMVVGNDFMAKQENVTLKTTDIVDVESNDMILIVGRGEYRVETVQTIPDAKQKNFAFIDSVSKTTYLTVRR